MQNFNKDTKKGDAVDTLGVNDMVKDFYNFTHNDTALNAQNITLKDVL